MTYVRQNEYNEAIYKIEIPADIDGLIFSDGNGNQTIDITSNLNDGTGFYISGSSNGKYTVGSYEYVEWFKGAVKKWEIISLQPHLFLSAIF